MTISVWRYSHLALAVSSFLLLTLAAITGVILALEPLVSRLPSYRAEGFKEVTLDQSLPVLRKVYPGITELSVTAQGFVQVKGTDNEGEELLAYVDPRSGKILGKPVAQSEFFQWVTALHRSLFLKEIGRFFIGLTSFLLVLITISGIMLVIQRQRGLKRFFTKVAKDSFAQYYHVVLSRWSLVPILILALTGTYLSLARFEIIDTKTESPDVDFEKIRTAPVKAEGDFDVFKRISLSEVEAVEFPFSEDVEDYYIIKLKTGEMAVNQVTGDVLAESKYPAAVFYTNLSLDLHTGRGSSIWAIVLGIASANILFFIYSGFAIAWKRRANRTRNQYKANEASIVILVGSENGSTFGFARALHGQLLKAGEKSYLTELNHYTSFPAAKHLVVFTATYGLGDPPTNAAKFAALLDENPQPQGLQYSVLGFGSHAYPDFCKFAFEVDRLLSTQDWAIPLIHIHTVNDRSIEEFGLWAETWSQQSGIPLTVLPELYSRKTRHTKQFKVVSKVPEQTAPGESFTISLQCSKRQRIQSGDLLAVYPAGDHRERLYSIGVIDKEIRLNIKLYAGGLGSEFFYGLKAGEQFRAKVIDNKHFHFPADAKEVVMISNGTGIAPFLGMISENTKLTPCHLYCGFRERPSHHRYEQFLKESLSAGKVRSLHVAFSRETEHRQYVSDLIEQDAVLMAEILGNHGAIMICGSLAMQKDVFILLESICQSNLNKELSYFQSRGQVLSDCY